MTTTIKETVYLAFEAAAAASAKYMAENGEPWYCGFAWVDVVVSRTNSKEAKELISAGFKTGIVPKTLRIWNPNARYYGQSINVSHAGAIAFAEVLQKAGFNAYANTRAD